MAAAAKQFQVQLSLNQISDIVSCLDFAKRQGAAYGHVTQKEQALLAGNRQRLIAKLERIYDDANRRPGKVRKAGA